MCRADRISMDGTFKSSPILFSQLYTFHCKTKEKSFPMLFALLPNKTAQTYRRLFDAIKTISNNLNLVFKPQEFLIDFEIAMIQAIQEKFREGNHLRGCYFHFAQAIWRKVYLPA